MIPEEAHARVLVSSKMLYVCEKFTCELDLLVTIFVLDFFQNKVKMTKWFCCYFADILHARHLLDPTMACIMMVVEWTWKISFELTKPIQCTQALLAPWWWSSIFSVNSGFDTEFMKHMKCDISNKDNHRPWNRICSSLLAKERAIHFSFLSKIRTNINKD